MWSQHPPRPIEHISGLRMNRRTALGLAASLLALTCSQRLSAASQATEPPTAAAEDDIFLLVDGWVLPGKHFRA